MEYDVRPEKWAHRLDLNVLFGHGPGKHSVTGHEQ